MESLIKLEQEIPSKNSIIYQNNISIKAKNPCGKFTSTRVFY